MVSNKMFKIRKKIMPMALEPLKNEQIPDNNLKDSHLLVVEKLPIDKSLLIEEKIGEASKLSKDSEFSDHHLIQEVSSHASSLEKSNEVAAINFF